ncbi:MAG: DUF2029 domain-containing protein, partial [Spirochaetota bacterium]|nr:DUF2029 domain-containing protein [Spirochaetota bacterium]
MGFWFTILLSLSGYFLIGYHIERNNFHWFFLVYSGLFLLYLKLAYGKPLSFRNIIALAFLFRLVLLLVEPGLSDDYHRFLWDGYLGNAGLNPYEYRPDELMALKPDIVGISEKLYSQLNSRGYYSIYPPLNQLFFRAAALISQGDTTIALVALRVFLILLDLLAIFVLSKLLNRLELSIRPLTLYALNPLVIIEFSGNLHFEVLVVLCLGLAVYFLIKRQSMLSAFAFSLSVLAKLMPVIVLPYLIKRLRAGVLLYYAVIGLITGLFFYNLWDFTIMRKFYSSLQLYFAQFEFNAGFYYAMKGIGTVFNIPLHKWIQPILPLLVFFLISLSAFREKQADWRNLFVKVLFAWTAYFFLATTVHPWYIIPLIAFSILTKYRYPILWSALIPLSYITYSTTPYTENLYLVALQYILLLIFLSYEILTYVNIPVRKIVYSNRLLRFLLLKSIP